MPNGRGGQSETYKAAGSGQRSGKPDTKQVAEARTGLKRGCEPGMKGVPQTEFSKRSHLLCKAVQNSKR